VKVSVSVGRAAAIALAALIGFFFARASTGLPHYGESRGPEELRFAIQALATRHATNLNAFVNFDYRSFDTLGEEFIFLEAIAGFSLLLAERRGEKSDEPLEAAPGRSSDHGDPVIRTISTAYAPIAILYGIYMAVHGQLTPGGGFQGGVIIATGVLALWWGGGYAAFQAIVPKEGAEAFETVGAIGYVAIGIAALAVAGVFLRNVLPFGSSGALYSGGIIDLLNVIVGAAIAGGFAVLFSEFVAETRADPDDA